MKKIMNIILGLLLTVASVQVASAQTVYPGDQEVEKVKLPGLFLVIAADGKQVEKDWEAQLQTYGRISSGRGVYKVSTANIPAISLEPINLISQVKTSKRSATIFTSFDLGGGSFVTMSNGNYQAAEKLLTEFAARFEFNQGVRVADDALAESQKNHQKSVRAGEKLQRDIETNKKDKERLLKRIDENAKELEQLLKDVETNKTDQANALTDMTNKAKAVEVVKAKKP
jgi:hypothetical protein